jgi:hypothetical protein
MEFRILAMSDFEDSVSLSERTESAATFHVCCITGLPFNEDETCGCARILG